MPEGDGGTGARGAYLKPTITKEVTELLQQIRQQNTPPVRLRDHAIKAAQPLIDDASRWKAAICTRRSAKSYTAALALLDAAQKQKSNVLYCGMEHTRIKADFWRSCIQDIDYKFKLNLKLNESELSVASPNGSYLYCLSIDANEKEKRKLRGGKYSLVVVDECQSFQTDLNSLITDVLQPATADYHGTIILLGTPGMICEGFWHDVTKKIKSGWSVHSWSAYDNPYIDWTGEIEALKQRTPGIEQTFSFRREYLGQWVSDPSALLYQFDEHKNIYMDLPDYAYGKWHKVLGIDLGVNHPAALVAVAYHDHDPCLYALEVQWGAGWSVTTTAERIHEMENRHTFERMIIDPSWKQTVLELQERHNLFLTIADKPGRLEMVELVNDQMLLSRIKANPIECAQLIHEWKTVGKEDVLNDDCADAFRYAFKYCYPFLSTEAPHPIVPGSKEWNATEVKKMQLQAIEQIKQDEERNRGVLDDFGFIPGGDQGNDIW